MAYCCCWMHMEAFIRVQGWGSLGAHSSVQPDCCMLSFSLAEIPATKDFSPLALYILGHCVDVGTIWRPLCLQKAAG